MSAREITRRASPVNWRLVFLAIAAAAAAPRAAGDNEAFVGGLRRAVARIDRTAVAAMVQYPMRVLAGGVPIPVSDRAALVKMYDLFFTPDMRCAIERGPLADTAEGLSIGGGTVWAQ